MKSKRVKIDVTEKEFETVIGALYLAGFDYSDIAYRAFNNKDRDAFRRNMALSKKYDRLGKKLSCKARFA